MIQLLNAYSLNDRVNLPSQRCYISSLHPAYSTDCCQNSLLAVNFLQNVGKELCIVTGDI